MVSVSVLYLFYQPMDEKIRKWTVCFPAKENRNMEKVLFDWPIVLQHGVKARYRLIYRILLGMKFFSPERLLNQPKATRVCVGSINQSNRSISVRLLFLFSSRVFILRSYENYSNCFNFAIHLLPGALLYMGYIVIVRSENMALRQCGLG